MSHEISHVSLMLLSFLCFVNFCNPELSKLHRKLLWGVITGTNALCISANQPSPRTRLPPLPILSIRLSVRVPCDRIFLCPRITKGAFCVAPKPHFVEAILRVSLAEALRAYS